MKLRTQLFYGYFVVFALMIFNATINYVSTGSLIKSQDVLDNTYRNIDAAGRIETLAIELQNVKRAVLLNRDDEFFQQFELTRKSFEKEMAFLKGSVANNPGQLNHLDQIESLISTWIENTAVRQMNAVRNPSIDTSKINITDLEDSKGRTLFREVFQKVQSFIQSERLMRDEQIKLNDKLAKDSISVVILGTFLAVGLGSLIVIFTSKKILIQIGGEPTDISRIAEEIGKGNLDAEFKGGTENATGIRAAIESMKASLKHNRQETQDREWLKTGIGKLNEVMSGDPELTVLATRAISEMASYVGAQVGACYILRNGSANQLFLKASYALQNIHAHPDSFHLGEALIGQAALENKKFILNDLPPDYVKISSALGERVPNCVCIMPFTYEGRVKGVIELGTFHHLSQLHVEYLNQAMLPFAIAAEAAERRAKLTEALRKSQELTEELQTQQEELRTTNEELEEQSRRLQESEKRLKTQQEELEATNEELEEKNELLKKQNDEVERSGKELEKRAHELALAGKYKSEFLSNMSHELRTPLNSLLLLAQSLSENSEGNLHDEQLQCARIIYNSGSDLLNLINEILDLARIESGRIDLQLGRIRTKDLAENIRAVFQPLVQQKSLELNVTIGTDSPEEIFSDRKRIEQIIRNLVSNAIKFTDSGSITVHFHRPSSSTQFSYSRLHSDQSCAVSVQDTGIGIAPDQHGVIFEAFQQLDGSSSRKHGGTGLGLSISRELALMLGGEIHVESKPGEGSIFTLYIPVILSPSKDEIPSCKSPTQNVFRKAQISPFKQEQSATSEVKDDRNLLQPSDKVILVIEDDARFARLLIGKCHERGFKCVIENSGEAGLKQAAELQPIGIVLDIRLPGMDGWSVLSALKDNIKTRHIPVHVLSVEKANVESIRKGAVGHFTKPISPTDFDATFQKIEELLQGKPKRVLIVEDDDEVRRQVVQLIGAEDVLVDEAVTGEEAIQAIRTTKYSCIVLDLGLPDMDSDELFKRLDQESISTPPIVIHTARELNPDQESAIREYAESIVIKDVRSLERLLDEVCLFLHSVVSFMPEEKRRIIRSLRETDEVLKDKKILIVDDDMRTVFALSRLLTNRGMKVLKAENGERAIHLLTDDPNVDIVLMDIMMPVMDGYQTISKIRENEQFRKLPIIALTAKAMPKDRHDCISAGANDYMTKPIDQERLISLLRVWLYR